MGLRNLIRRLERSASGEFESFTLLDGSTFYYDRREAYKELFLYCYDMELGNAEEWRGPPEILRKICQAQDPAAVLARFAPRDPVGAFVNLPELLDTNVLIRERRLVPRGE